MQDLCYYIEYPRYMPASNLDELSLFIKKSLSIMLILMLFNLALQGWLGDFWGQPMSLQAKLGLYGYENMVLLVSTALLLMVSYILFRVNCRKLAYSVQILSAILVLGVSVASWSHFENFNRFIGVYAVQMLFQDGGQLLSFASKMPSAVNRPLFVLAIAAVVLIVYLALSNNRTSKLLNAVFAPVCLMMIVSSAIASSLWNHAENVPSMGDLKAEGVMQRVRDSEFSVFESRTGPFTAIVSSISSVVFAADMDLSIQSDRLVNRQAELRVPTEGVNKYNVVYILVESLHPGVLEAYGGKPEIMPTVNELAKSSKIFANAFSQASHSNYADVSAVSGQYPLRSMNIHFYPKDPSYPKSLPYDMLKPLGYRVGLFSSQNEQWGQMENYLSSPSVDIFSHVGSTTSRANDPYSGIEVTMLEDGKASINYNDFMFQGSGDEIERLDGRTTDIALEWLSEGKEDSPFFMYFNFQASHSPFNALPEDFQPIFFTETDDHAERVRKGYSDHVPLQYVINAYWDSLHYVDSNIARVVNYIKSIGQHENTIYVVTADTSIRFSAGLIGNGGELYPDVLRVPIVMKIPGSNEAEIITEPVAQIDIMPTVLSAIGVGPHPASQGINVLADRDPDRVIYSVAQTPAAHQYSAIFHDWQLVHDYNTDKYRFNYFGVDKTFAQENPLSESTVEMMLEKLGNWKKSQLAYYSSEGVQSEYYPPAFDSALWKSGESPVVVSEGDPDSLE